MIVYKVVKVFLGTYHPAFSNHEDRWHFPARERELGSMSLLFLSTVVSKPYELKESKHRSDEQQAPSWSTIYKQIA
jgi:hypothetical protein